jgi:hypothetical protein
VRALYFGDTGTPLDRKEARFNLGPLECHGDTLFTNSITFRRQDGVIELPTFEMGLTSGDIFFEFKTSSERPMVLLHSTGDNGDFIKVHMVAWFFPLPPPLKIKFFSLIPNASIFFSSGIFFAFFALFHKFYLFIVNLPIIFLFLPVYFYFFLVLIPLSSFFPNCLQLISPPPYTSV